MQRTADAIELRPGLYVVATPIGNLSDISERALHVLRTVDEILCEDTRTSQTLLRHYAIQQKLSSFHDHNEKQRVQALLEKLRAGAKIALISDAGTPLISDPGYSLVAALRADGQAVYAIPGPSALTAALSICGLPCERFSFEGFLPSSAGARKAALAKLSGDARTLVFYESTHRILGMLQDAQSVLALASEGTRRAAVVKEISKHFERCSLGTLPELIEEYRDNALQRGEFVVIIEGNHAGVELGEAKRIQGILAKSLSPSLAAKLASKITGVSRRLLYLPEDMQENAEDDPEAE